MKIGRKNFILLGISFFLVIASLYLPKTFYSDTDLDQVFCGLPLSFISGVSSKDPPFPWTTHCLGILSNGVIDVLWIPFILNILIVFGALFLLKPFIIKPLKK